MANTYSKIYLHVVFAVKNRQSLIRKQFKEELYKYITGIVQNHGTKVVSNKWSSRSRAFIVGLYNLNPARCTDEGSKRAFHKIGQQ